MDAGLARRCAAACLLSACAPAPPRPAGPALAARPPPQPPAPVAMAPPPAEPGPQPIPCGALDCRWFDSPEAAFAAVLADTPRVLAVGEAHAQQGSEGVTSATRRFGERLLPLLQGRASDLVIELWTARGDCGAREQEVAKRQAPVTASQAAGNQGEFIELGRRAKSLGITPHALSPSCEEYERIVAGGEADIALMLEAIARTTANQVSALLAERAPDRLVVAYGGAVHNDVEPRPGRERWSFGPELVRASQNRYVELDLIVPEYIKDNDVWRALPWYPYFDRTRHPEKTTLYRLGQASYVLVFPTTCAGGCAEAPAAPSAR